MKDGFPLLTTKKMAWKTMVTELLWFLRGDTNIKYLVDNNCHIWDGDAYKNYGQKIISEGYQNLVAIGWPSTQEEFIDKIKTDDEFAKKWGELGPIYGKQWRSWEKWYIDENKRYLTFTKKIDQIQNLINDLKTNPDSRRLMVNAWNVGELDKMVLPPCHYGFQVYTRELTWEERWEQYIKLGLNIEVNGTPLELKHMGTPFYPKSLPQRAISLMWNQRSCDVPLGIPMNIASYALLLTIIATEVNMVPDELIGNLGDCHIYLNQIDGVNEQLTRDSFELPKLVISNQVNFGNGIDEILNSCLITDFVVENYQSHPKIYFPLSN
jgi:thymidylate synthase